MNSPETELFHKGRELYGLYLARQRVGRLDTLIVVEGYTDVVALAQYGMRNAVATLGTATTPDQAGLLFRAAEIVIFCFDGDEAGRKAAWRALQATLPKLKEGVQARFLFLPEGEDPDSLVRQQGKEAFEALLAKAQPLSDFLFEHFTAQVDMDSLDGRAKLVQLALPLLETLPPGVFKDMMIERLESLARHRIRGGGGGGRNVSGTPARPRTMQGPTPVRLALAHLVQNPELVQLAGEMDEIRDADVKGVDIFLHLVDFCAKRPNMTTAQLLELLHEHPAQEHLAKLASWQLPGDPERQAMEFRDAVTGIRLQWTEALLARMPKIVEQSSAQREQYLVLQQRQQALKRSLQTPEN
jgi:DNA primase